MQRRIISENTSHLVVRSTEKRVASERPAPGQGQGGEGSARDKFRVSGTKEMVEGAGANKESGAVSRTEAAAAAELRTSQSRRVRDFHPIGYVRSGRTKQEADH